MVKIEDMDIVAKWNLEKEDGPASAPETRTQSSAQVSPDVVDKSLRRKTPSPKFGSAAEMQRKSQNENLKTPRTVTAAPAQTSSVQRNRALFESMAKESKDKSPQPRSEEKKERSASVKGKASPKEVMKQEDTPPQNSKLKEKRTVVVVTEPSSFDAAGLLSSGTQPSSTKEEEDLIWSLMNLLNSDPDNKVCADCRTPLLEIGRISCSFHARNHLPGVGLCSPSDVKDNATRRLSVRTPGVMNTPKPFPEKARALLGNDVVPKGISLPPSSLDAEMISRRPSTQKPQKHTTAKKTSNVGGKRASNSSPSDAVAARDPASKPKPSIDDKLPSPSSVENVESTPVQKKPRKVAVPLAPVHGVFICQGCSVVHKALGSHVTMVANLGSLMSGDGITRDVVTIMLVAKGNTASNAFLEHFIPQEWKDRIPNSQSSLEQREIFARAKYEVLAFAFMHGPVDVESSAWNKILWESTDACVPTVSSNISLAAPPNRLVDYFCVVGPSPNDDPDAVLFPYRLTKSSLESAGSILAQNPPALHKLDLQASVLHSHPTVPHQDTRLPTQLGKFVFPNGCGVTTSEQPPRYFWFVLTLESGLRLYGHALIVYDSSVRTADVLKALSVSRTGNARKERTSAKAELFSLVVPSFEGNSIEPSPENTVHLSKYCKDRPLLFLPKALVLLSHYPFHSQFRSSLLNLYRISLVEAPLPIERYITNLVTEVPLPPAGRVRVRYSLSASLPTVSFERPPTNELPMASFSYRPLFATLSVSNVLVVFGLLLQETSVVLCSSESLSLLTSVAEALTSLLFPLVWQGCYIPVLPRDMLDVLHAPVPFLVGVHGPYLKEVKPEFRPPGIVFVDLDKDEVHLGTVDGDGEVYGRELPPLPKKAALKLLSSVEESIGNVYLARESGIKGRITYGYGTVMENSFREEYAYEVNTMSLNSSRHAVKSVGSSGSSTAIRRAAALKMLDRAYPNEEHLMPISNFLGEDGSNIVLDTGITVESNNKKSKNKRAGTVLSATSSDVASSKTWKQILPMSKIAKNQATVAENRATNDLSSLGVSSAPGDFVATLHDSDLDDINRFSSDELRKSFLRFFTSTLRNYQSHIQSNGTFDRNEFFKCSPQLQSQCYEFLSAVLETQMFQRLIEEKMANPTQAELQLFDESIIAKKNRSKTKVLQKKDTPFLMDESQKVRELYSPPQPSNWGLPGDGTAYRYTSGFPAHFDESLFGNVRPPKQWLFDVESSSPTSAQRRLAANPVYIVNSLYGGGLNNSGTAADLPERDVVWAIHVMASKHFREEAPRKPISHPPRRVISSRKVTEGGNNDVANVEQSVAMLSRTVVPVALGLLDSARRKQSELVRQVIRLQSYVTMHICKVRYERHVKSALKLQNLTRTIMLRRRYGNGFSLLYCRTRDVQRLHRGHVARRLCRRYRVAIISIQSAARMRMLRKYFSLLTRWSVAMQSIYRGRCARVGYFCVREVISCVQAVVRGWFTRSLWLKFRRHRIIRYRRQIFELWERAYRPLIYRTKFWKFERGLFGFRHLAIHEDELIRLWIYLGLKPLHCIQSGDGEILRAFSANSEVVATGLDELTQQLGFKSQEVHQRFLIVQRKLDKIRVPVFQAFVPAFPEELRVSVGGSERLFMARKQLMIERAELYEKLKYWLDEGALFRIYESFRILQPSRRKKEKLVGMLWRSPEFIDASCEVVLLKATHLRNYKRSKRARQIYGIGKEYTSPITDNLLVRSNQWVQEKYDQRMREDLLASCRAMFSSVQSLLEEQRERASRQMAVPVCISCRSVGETKAEIVRRYFSCQQHGKDRSTSWATYAREIKRQERGGVQDLVDHGLEISIVREFPAASNNIEWESFL